MPYHLMGNDLGKATEIDFLVMSLALSALALSGTAIVLLKIPFFIEVSVKTPNKGKMYQRDRVGCLNILQLRVLLFLYLQCDVRVSASNVNLIPGKSQWFTVYALGMMLRFMAGPARRQPRYPTLDGRRY